MLKLSRIFFTHLLVLLASLFLLISIFTYFIFKTIEIDNFASALKKEAILVEMLLGHNPPSDAFVKMLDQKIGDRITLIDPKGRVIAESRYDKKRMENHLSRPEIQEALHRGWGQSVRHSATLHQDFLYVAKKSDDLIVRLAHPLARIEQAFFTIWLEFLALFGAFSALALLASYILSAKMDRQMKKIVEYLNALSHKVYDYPLSVGFAKEFHTIAKHLKKLSSKLAKREAKKEKFTKKIKQISRQRNELIEAVSHEFKNPVAIIHGYAETLVNEPDMPVALRQRFIQKIYDASNKITSMIDRLALAMKFESGNLEPKKSRFDMCEVAKEVVELLQQRYPKRTIKLRCEPSIVEADRAMIEVAMSNLLDNALKYSELSVEVRVENGRFCVQDRGMGIKEEELNKITKKFYRIKKSWDNSMGLGLFIVGYILKLHGSRLEIESRYQEGSRFCFGLPTSTLQE